MRLGPASEAKPPPLNERALSAEPVIDPLIVAPLTLAGIVVELDNGVGADGDEDEQALALHPIAISDMNTISLLRSKGSPPYDKKSSV
jgi:hypothetical protein